MSFDSNDWDDDDDGAFDDTEAVFGEAEPVNAPAPQQDTRMQAPPAQTQNAPRQKAALVASFGQDGQPMVARHVMKDGRPMQLEPFRRPTPDEYNAIMFGGKLVRGGVVAEDVPTGTNLDAQMQRAPLGESAPKKKWLMGLGGVVLVGGLGYGIYRWRKNRG
jgi:hypothetical protein